MHFCQLLSFHHSVLMKNWMRNESNYEYNYFHSQRKFLLFLEEVLKLSEKSICQTNSEVENITLT